MVEEDCTSLLSCGGMPAPNSSLGRQDSNLGSPHRKRWTQRQEPFFIGVAGGTGMAERGMGRPRHR